MNSVGTIITRNELYRKVWSMPLRAIAEEYGITSSRLKEICLKLQVPRPDRGYWQKLQYGKSIKSISLPILSDPSSMDSYTLAQNDFPSKPSRDTEIKDEGIKKLIDLEQLPENKIVVPDRLDSPHEYISISERTLKGGRIDDAGLLYGNQINCIPMKVSPKNLSRALLIMDALVKALDQRGYKISLPTQYRDRPSISILEVKIEFMLSETYTRKLKELTEKEKREKVRNPIYWNQYICKPTGILRFKIYPKWSSDIKTQWNDGADGRLEDKLNSVIAGLIMTAHRVGQQEHDIELNYIKWEEEKREKQEIERLRIEEENRIKELSTGR